MWHAAGERHAAGRVGGESFFESFTVSRLVRVVPREREGERGWKKSLRGREESGRASFKGGVV